MHPFKASIPLTAEQQGLYSHQWGNVLYDTFLAATSRSKSEHKLQHLVDSEDAWADMIALLLAEDNEPLDEQGPWWSHMGCCLDELDL